MYQLGQILVTTVTKVDKEYQVSNLLTMRNNDRTRVNNQFCNAWVWFALPQALLDSVSARQGEEATMETLHGVTQKQGSIKVDLCNKSLVLNFHNTEGVQREIARMNSLGLPHQGDWLSVVPCPALGLHLRGPEFISCQSRQLEAGKRWLGHCHKEKSNGHQIKAHRGNGLQTLHGWQSLLFAMAMMTKGICQRNSNHCFLPRPGLDYRK